MKKLPTISVLLTAIILWCAALIIVPSMTQLLTKLNCESLKEDQCQQFISTLGSTGDIFGAVTSLFSGLALFAVAITLWADSNSRRESRRPFLMAELNSDSLELSSPIPTGEKSITLKANLSISNQVDEAAFNITLKSILKHQGLKLQLPHAHLAFPLMGKASGEIKLDCPITGGHFNNFLSQLTSGNPIELDTEIIYENIEGVKWTTSAIYELTCTHTIHRNRLNAARGNNEDFAKQWENDPAVPLSPAPKSGTWKHSKS
ncbi:hypothetical protein [Pseudomonas sp. CGJS7]|uniref:hypothetical protein n=1 Tax=Pseudomonas sp. CGJS7 TaxID=3109348 RepID=UPI00300ACEB9